MSDTVVDSSVVAKWILPEALFVALSQDLGLSGVTADEPLYNVVQPGFPKIILLRNW